MSFIVITGPVCDMFRDRLPGRPHGHREGMSQNVLHEITAHKSVPMQSLSMSGNVGIL